MGGLYGHSPGGFTPEVSPLEQFINRGRLLEKELHNSSNSSSTERRTPPPTRSSSSQRDPYRDDYSVMRPYRSTTPGTGETTAPQQPVELRMPRFSTITNDSFGDRDSMYSNDRDSSIMGAFSFGFNGSTGGVAGAAGGVNTADLPDIQSAPKSVKQEPGEPRDSIRPTISHLDEDDQPPHVPRAEFGNPVRESVRPLISSVEDDDDGYYPPNRDHARRGPSPSPRYPPQPSQPLPPRNHQQPPVRQLSGDGHRHPQPPPPPPTVDPAYGGRQYVPYRKDSASSSSPTGYGPPSRQGSAESGMFPPPARTGSGDSARRLQAARHDPRGAAADRRYGPPSRQNSSEAEPARYVPYRQGSGDHSMPARQSSMEGRGGGVHRQQRRAPSPQPPPSSILPMISDIRTLSPSPDGTIGDSQPPPPSSSSSPPFPNPWAMERSPSAASDANSMHSVGGTRTPKPLFNFSRPLSTRPSVDSQHRPSIDIPPAQNQHHHHHHHHHHLGHNDSATPMSMSEEARDFGGDESGPAPTYVYTKFDLPRGRAVERDSVIFQDSHAPYQQGVEMRQHSSNIRLVPSSPSSSPPPPPPPKDGATLQPLTQPRSSRALSAPNTPRPSLSAPSTGRTANSSAGLPRSPHLHVTPAANLDPDEHLRIGIDLHEKGSLQESTYHLRCAAHAGHATGMLLYALACRHGWGMRPNQKEGVNWLKKVTELASSEVADDEKGITNVAFGEKQGRRAQFALSIYELGVSHLNGWGTEMDKGLALNCFEIAGSELSLSTTVHPRC